MSTEKKLERSVPISVSKFSFWEDFRITGILVCFLLLSLFVNYLLVEKYLDESQRNKTVFKQYVEIGRTYDKLWEMDDPGLQYESRVVMPDEVGSLRLTDAPQFNNSESMVCFAQPEGMLLLPSTSDTRFCSDLAYHLVFSQTEDAWYGAYRACLTTRSRHAMSPFSYRTLNR